MNVPEYFNRWLQMLDQIWLGLENLSHLVRKVNDLLLLDGELLEGLDCFLAFLWLKKLLDEKGVQRLIMVLLDKRGLDIWSKLSWLLLQLIDRYLADH